MTWDAVAGADYDDDFFDSSCRVSRGGSPSFCEELATNVVEATYVHADPVSNENFYCVAARTRCSDIDSENPAARLREVVGGDVDSSAVVSALSRHGVRLP